MLQLFHNVQAIVLIKSILVKKKQFKGWWHYEIKMLFLTLLITQSKAKNYIFILQLSYNVES
jgi:hypothetical protein